jgi:hypothetical protein
VPCGPGGQQGEPQHDLLLAIKGVVARLLAR